jgi:poly-gamma-glutamate capsule biosynthesis protein CapA/YwtB (metallophosphatase superfamily)
MATRIQNIAPRFLLIVFPVTLWAATSFLSVSHASPAVAVRIRAVGDMMLGNASTNQVPQDNFLQPVFSETRKADIVFGNYEGTLCNLENVSSKCQPGQKGCFTFRGPTRLARDLRQAGFHVLNLANNHIFDYGPECASETKAALEDEGMVTVGLKSSSKASNNEIMSSVVARGKQIGFLGFHYGGSRSRLVSMNDGASVQKLIQSAKKSHDLVIVSVHAGAEGPNHTRVPYSTEFFAGENRGNMRLFSKLAIDAGADVVIGHGPHVLRGIEIYKKKIILYSLGNFATYSSFAFDHPMQLGAIVEIGLSDQGDFVEGLIIPTYQYYEKSQITGIRSARINFDPYARAISEFKRLSELDFKESPLISKDGRVTP